MYKEIHFMGIGGIGMSGIAQLFLEQGIKVSGCDIKDSERLEMLRAKGAKIYLGHDSSHIQGQDLVVYSSAIKEDNPELKEAYKRNIKVLKRAQALAEIVKDATLITITGSHGKTTTSSLIAHILKEAGLEPTVVVGGIWLNLNNSACLGKERFFVVEADESDGSFLYFKPNYSIITNIDFEHMDYYKNMDNLLVVFQKFMENIHLNGCLIVCVEDKNIISVLNKVNQRRIIYGFFPQADIYAQNIKFEGLSSSFDCFWKENFLGNFLLSLGGRHNVLNSLAAISLAKELGIKTEVIKDALSSFKGIRRRIEIKACVKGMLFIDDYAHHPTEIKATLNTVRDLGYKRIIAIFQPHRFTRTKLLLDEFSRSFAVADIVVITDIYPADEIPIEGITGRSIFERINFYKHPAAKFLPKEEILPYLLEIIKEGDLVITLGAGDVYKVADELVQRFKEQNSH